MKAPDSGRRKSSFPVTFPTVVAIFLLSSNADASEWKIRPRMNLIETYSDNLRLRSGPGSTDDFITQINPGILVNGVASRYTVDVNYLMNNLIYAQNGNFNRIQNQLNANGTGELIKDLFFVDGRAFITQQNVSLLGPQAINNVNVTGNRTNVSTYVLSPYLRHRFQNFATTELRYTRNWVNSSTNGLASSTGDGVLFNLNSGTAFKTFGWGVNYSNQMIHFDSGRDIELERSTGTLRYMLTPQFGLNATGGYERNSFVSIRGSPSAPLWTVGFAWEPTQRTNISVSGGQRFFGNTYNALARHRTRLMVWTFGYNQDITTFNQQSAFGVGVPGNLGGSLNQLLTAQNPNLSPDIIQQNTAALTGIGLSGSFFNPTNFLTNRLFLQKTLQASVVMNGSRNTITASLFDMTRQAYSDALVDINLVGAQNAALLNHTRQSGVNALWNYRLSERTSANLNFAYTRFKFLGAGREDDLMLVMLGLTRQFRSIQPNLSGMLQVRHQQRDSNQPGSDYREQAVIGSLNMSF
jgi:uncharacterized protein (PEP-CTERM system associated)